ncbi:MAG: hypothetical protein H6678_15355, partial [Candidatus Delongbacteria bacterium]|nr:hypothetical protein [Candidatus Delongbacteria bacterium]
MASQCGWPGSVISPSVSTDPRTSPPLKPCLPTHEKETQVARTPRLRSKFIFITGGVVSSLGKGITISSLGILLQARGLKVNVIKLDPYLNVDAGTMNPYQHGEVYVTEDGAETDLDLGHYERFLDITT